MSALTSAAFRRLVAALKGKKQTCAVVESSCGGIIQGSIMAIPGSSAVFWGGTVAYNTRKSRPILLNDAALHSALKEPLERGSAESSAELYIRSKMEHTRLAAAAYCEQMGTHFAIAEAGATGPTFRPEGIDLGFTVIAVAARCANTGEVSIVRQDVVRSPHADREKNMRIFADAAARLALDAVQEDGLEGNDSSNTDRHSHGERRLDRATKLRANTEELTELAASGKYVVLRGNQSLFGENFELAILDKKEVDLIRSESGAESQMTFLGIVGGNQAFFGVDLLGGTEDAVDKAAVDCFEGAHFSDTRTSAPLLPPLQNELVLHATALSQWQRRNSFCPSCGGRTSLIHGCTCLRCEKCGGLSWPRQDPSMIAVVQSRDGNKILLARSKRHPPRLHTALAGFVEAGETFEKAVAREVFEETGVRIDEDSVEYIGSQPWPFPQSCMIAFNATADDEQPLNLDPDEIVEGRWFHKDEVRAATAVPGPTMRKAAAEVAIRENPDLPLLVPPKGVIARTLIDTWLDRLPL